jgi:hypothetical protein
VPNSNINESVWKTLIDCETFLKIIPCSHGPHLAREKTATALKTKGLKKIAIASIHKLLRTVYILIITDQMYDYNVANNN